MSPRDTRTGYILEQMILPALDKGGYTYKIQQNVGKRIGGRKHYVDVIITDRHSRNILVSLKWQQVSGTAEQKVPFEVICLIEAIQSNSGKFDKAYLVLGGAGWSLREYYMGGELGKYLAYDKHVTIVSLEEFIALANKGKL